jgi:8-hydroxy-5-deazaflavin:NADPH oxidoreductase
MRIGIIGSGSMGSTLGKLWSQAGHDILYSSRHPEELGDLVDETPRSKAVAIDVAARDGEALFLGVPYAAMPELSKTLVPLVKGKLVLDAGNVMASRDGALATEVKSAGRGSGGWTQSILPGARVVKAFNTVHFRNLAKEAHRKGDRIAVPLAGDDAAALEQAAALVRDAGQEPVVLPGGIAASARIDFGSPVWNTNMTASQVRAALKL